MLVMTTKGYKTLAKVCITFSLIFILIAVYLGYRSYSFQQIAISTKGQIVELVERTDSEGGTLFAPVFTFTDNQGQVQKVYSSVSSYPPIGNVGDTIDILYDPKNPKNADIDTFFSNWGGAIILGGLGLVQFLMFIVVLVIQKKNSSDEGRDL